MANLTEKTWKDFQSTGLLWWINRLLHVFGWAIVLEVEEEGTVARAYPARCRFRGFPEAAEAKGFEQVARYLRSTADILFDEADYPPPTDSFPVATAEDK